MSGTLIKVLAAALVGSALGLLLKRDRPEISLLLGIALTSVALYAAIEILGEAISFIRKISAAAGIPNATLGIVLKTSGISVLTKFISDICKEADKLAAADAVELVGAASAIYIALPLFQTVVDMLNSML